jgi:hypothetical protein
MWAKRGAVSPGDDGCSTGVGLVQARPFSYPGVGELLPSFCFLWSTATVPQRKGGIALPLPPSPLRTQRYDSNYCTAAKVPGGAGVF